MVKLIGQGMHTGGQGMHNGNKHPVQTRFVYSKNFDLRGDDRAPSSFGEVILSSAIQLLSGYDQAFAVKSTALVGAIGHHRHLERSDRAPRPLEGRYCRQRSNFYRGTIGLLPSDPTPGRSDRAPSSFGEVEAKLYHRRLLREAMVKLHRCRPLKA
ncbi:hypothetical protein E5676_scaffold162G00450 [Cucumis melo var. makuwa]|uniref:Uncharacterized protein n=1 Tax=Cucumis melo var. makuwa TaxID=1194695 RepID=A0A5D3DJS6_CUCMM|nr:hypothetical protein E5676_scaffold162G00450 [Cucumis melo var. makuwa]